MANKETTEQGKIDVGQALTRSEQFFENNQKIISIIGILILVVFGGYFLYKILILKPLEEEAQAQMFMAERYFERDSFNLALNGDGNYVGFYNIIDEYSSTKTGNLAYYYAGISNLYLEQYDKAIEYLTKFDAKDFITPSVKSGAIGDAYMEKGEIQKALSFYLKASKANENEFTTPIYLMKAAIAYEELKDYKNALTLYEQIKTKYPKSKEGESIDKYIALAKQKS